MLAHMPASGGADNRVAPRQRRFWPIEVESPDVNDSRHLVGAATPVIAILSWDTSGDLARSTRWAELLGPAGLGDEVRAPLVLDGHGWGLLSRPIRGAGGAIVSAIAARLAAPEPLTTTSSRSPRRPASTPAKNPPRTGPTPRRHGRRRPTALTPGPGGDVGSRVTVEEELISQAERPLPAHAVTPTETELAAQGKDGLAGLLSVPAGAHPVPMLLFLHGRGEAGVGLDGTRQPLQAVGNNEAPSASPAARKRFAVLAPQAPASAGANIWAGLLTPVAELLERARKLLGERADTRLFVCGFSQGAFATVEFAGANAGAVVAWVGVDAARRVPVEPTLAASAARLPHLLLAGPAGFRRNGLAPDDVFERDGLAPDLLARDEIQLAGRSHVDMCREVYSGRLRLGNGDSIYDWLLRQSR